MNVISIQLVVISSELNFENIAVLKYLSDQAYIYNMYRNILNIFNAYKYLQFSINQFLNISIDDALS